MKTTSMENSRKLIQVLTYAFLLLGTLIMIFPFIWMLLTSSKTVPESMQIPPTIFPENFTLGNFTDVMKSLPFVNLYFNTGMMILFRVICAVVFSSMAGYAFAKLNFKYKNQIGRAHV